MNKLYFFFSIMVFFVACNSEANKPITELQVELSKSIDDMANRDKQMQLNMIQFSGATEAELDNVIKIREQVYEKHALEIDKILDKYGYPSYEIVGRNSTDNFFTLVQHSSKFPEIKKKALAKMEEKLNSSNFEKGQYILLSDQIAFEQKQASQYGTIVNFKENGQAFLDFPSDSIEVNRAKMGMDSLKFYLNRKTIEFYKQNQAFLQEKGLTQPVLYK